MLAVVNVLAGHITSSNSILVMSTVDSSRYWDTRTDKIMNLDHTPHDQKATRRSVVNSSQDPTVQSSKGEKTVSSNSRSQPRAELTSQKSASNHVHNHTSFEKKRKHKDDDDIWTEHKSSSGRIYFYNKRLDKSQWERPLKGTIKKLKSESQTPSRSQTGSHSSGTHTHASKSHHESGSSHRHLDHHSSKRKIDKKPSNKNNKTQTTVAVTSPSTPVSGRLSNVASPSSQTTPTAISSNQLSRRIMTTPENPLLSHQTSPYMVATGPSTPVQTYVGWGGTPVTPGNDGSGLHPLQRALMLQNQYSQGYQATPTTPIHPHTPINVVPTVMGPSLTTPTTPVTPIQPGLVFPQYHQEQPLLSATSSQKLKVPMSRLGTWPRPEDDFPDPNSLKPLPQLSNSDLFNISLTQDWWSPLESCYKQMDNAHLETLSRTTVDLGYHCGQLARNLLALECCRMKTVSRTTRITNLKKTMEIIEKR